MMKRAIFTPDGLFLALDGCGWIDRGIFTYIYIKSASIYPDKTLLLHRPTNNVKHIFRASVGKASKPIARGYNASLWAL